MEYTSFWDHPGFKEAQESPELATWVARARAHDYLPDIEGIDVADPFSDDSVTAVEAARIARYPTPEDIPAHTLEQLTMFLGEAIRHRRPDAPQWVRVTKDVIGWDCWGILGDESRGIFFVINVVRNAYPGSWRFELYHH